MTKVSLVRPGEMHQDQLDAWRQLQLASPTLDSPFYAPEFTQAVARFRHDVEVAVITSGKRYVGFFPFQRGQANVGRPVGWKLNDFQGGVFAPDAIVKADDLIRRCGLSSWHFDHVPATQRWCERAHLVRSESPYIDVTNGFDAYLAAKGRSGSSRIATTQRKARKLARDIGALRLEIHSADQCVFECLRDWKSQQLRRMKVFNVLESRWAIGLLRFLNQADMKDCRGMLSALYAGDELVAVHLGIRNDRVLHWWVSTYNPEYETYSPGTVLLLQLVDEVTRLGIHRIDLGKGEEPYKRSFQSGVTILAEGAVARSPWKRTFHHITYRTRHWIRSSRLRGVARASKRFVRQIRCFLQLQTEFS